MSDLTNVLELEEHYRRLVFHSQILFRAKSLKLLEHQSLLILQRFNLVQVEVSVVLHVMRLLVLR